mgnify:FL=1
MLSLCSFSSKAEEVCPSGTVGLCDPTVLETIVETVTETTQNDGQGTLTTTVTTTVTTTDTVTNEDSGDLLSSDSTYVSSSKQGDMDSDWGGEGPASMPSGNSCGSLGTDKCAEITGSGNTTSVMGVPNMGTTFKQTINISSLNITKGGKTTYTIKVDKQDASDSIYMHITGKNGNTTSFAGTDILSAAGTASGYAEYTGGFDFADSLTSLIVEIGGRDINLAVGPMFDDVTINVLYNVVSQIVLQSITTVEQYVLHNDGASETEIEIVKDIFDNNIPVEQPDGNLDFEPIDGGDTNEDSYESVELELELDFEMDFEMDLEMPEMDLEFDMPDMTIEAPVTAVDVEMEMDIEVVEVTEAPVEEIEVAAVEPEPAESAPEPEPQKETVEQEPESQPEPETQDEPEAETQEEEVKEEPKKEEAKPEPKKEETKKPVTKVAKKKVAKPKTKAQKKEAKEKAGSKIVKKMGDKGRYDSANQLKTLIVMQVLGDTKEFFSAQKMLPDIQGFFTSGVVPDAEIKDNNFASFMLTGKSHVSMNALIDLQYK